MKHVFFIMFCLGIIATSWGQELANTEPSLKFTTTTLDYGKIKKGSDPVRKFAFKNQRNKSTLITQVQTSCGCTAVSYPKKAILGGEDSTLEVSYDTNRLGIFTKSISVMTDDGHTQSIFIKGEVIE